MRVVKTLATKRLLSIFRHVFVLVKMTIIPNAEKCGAMTEARANVFVTHCDRLENHPLPKKRLVIAMQNFG